MILPPFRDLSFRLPFKLRTSENSLPGARLYCAHRLTINLTVVVRKIEHGLIFDRQWWHYMLIV